MTPGTIEQPQKEPLPEKGTDSGTPQSPPQDEESVQPDKKTGSAGKDAASTGKESAPTGNDVEPAAKKADPNAAEPAVPGSKDAGPAGKESAPGSGKPAPAGKEPAPAQGNLPDKPPISPPMSSGNQAEPTSTAPGVTISSSFFGEVPPAADGGNRLTLAEAVPTAFFTHGPVPQASSADSVDPCNENGCVGFSPSAER